MIGDAAKILNAVRDFANLRMAFWYALRDRRKDYYYDHFELPEKTLPTPFPLSFPFVCPLSEVS